MCVCIPSPVREGSRRKVQKVFLKRYDFFCVAQVCSSSYFHEGAERSPVKSINFGAKGESDPLRKEHIAEIVKPFLWKQLEFFVGFDILRFSGK